MSLFVNFYIYCTFQSFIHASMWMCLATILSDYNQCRIADVGFKYITLEFDSYLLFYRIKEQRYKLLKKSSQSKDFLVPPNRLRKKKKNGLNAHLPFPHLKMLLGTITFFLFLFPFSFFLCSWSASSSCLFFKQKITLMASWLVYLILD